jgi:hypothetical protein
VKPEPLPLWLQHRARSRCCEASVKVRGLPGLPTEFRCTACGKDAAEIEVPDEC